MGQGTRCFVYHPLRFVRLVKVLVREKGKPMLHNRRQFLVGSASAALACGLFGSEVFSQERKKTRLILLGTKGGPRVGEAGRSNPATLILINDVPYLVDCGYGVTRQLLLAGVAVNRLRYVFITH